MNSPENPNDSNQPGDELTPKSEGEEKKEHLGENLQGQSSDLGGPTKLPAEAPPDQLTAEWRAEAIFRLFNGIGIADRNNGTPLKGCWVPLEAIDSETGEILAERNNYCQVRINGENYPAHVAVLMLVHNRPPIRNGGPEVNEVGMHMCNNPACRNPIHLKFGTSQDDSTYKVECGRAPSGPSNGHSTKPWATKKGDTHYNSRLKGEQRKLALQLLKKYVHHRGAVRAIAEYLKTTATTIYNLKRKGAHLDPSMEDTTVVLDISAWKPIAEKQQKSKSTYEERRRIAAEIRRRFHGAPLAERSGLLLQMETGYEYSSAWIRKILKRAVFEDVAPEIPIPTEWGIGRRQSFKRKPKQ